jgi:hypothetical protein
MVRKSEKVQVPAAHLISTLDREQPLLLSLDSLTRCRKLVALGLAIALHFHSSHSYEYNVNKLFP